MSPAKKRKQYFVSNVAVTFTAAEEKRVLKKAKLLGATVEDLIHRAIRSKKSHAAISNAINALGAPSKRQRTR